MRNPIDFIVISHTIDGILSDKYGNVGPPKPLNIPYMKETFHSKENLIEFHTIDVQVITRIIHFSLDNFFGSSDVPILN